MDHSRERGRFAQVTSEAITLRRKGRDVTLDRTNVLKIDSVSRLRGLGWGVLVGGGTGFVVGAISDIGPNEGGEGALGRVIFSSFGLIAGSIAGTLHQKRRTLYRATSLERQSIVSATHDAEVWLALLDSQDYDQAWLDASDLLRDADVEQAWIGRVDTGSRRDGQLLKRTSKATQFLKSLPNLPGGPFVTIDFTTKREPQTTTRESLTLVRADGRWKVARFSEATLR